MTSGRILDKTGDRVYHRVTNCCEVRRLVAGEKALQSHQYFSRVPWRDRRELRVRSVPGPSRRQHLARGRRRLPPSPRFAHPAGRRRQTSRLRLQAHHSLPRIAPLRAIPGRSRGRIGRSARWSPSAISRSSASKALRAASAATRSVMSIPVGCKKRMTPALSTIGCIANSITRSRPSALSTAKSPRRSSRPRLVPLQGGCAPLWVRAPPPRRFPIGQADHVVACVPRTSPRPAH